MNKTTKDTTIPICSDMTLEIKEVRGTSTAYDYKEGFQEISSNTRSHFHWKLSGISSKLAVGSDGFDVNKQEVYDVAFRSHGFDIGCFGGFKSRGEAIQSALSFAGRNGIEVDGYAPKPNKGAR